MATEKPKAPHSKRLHDQDVASFDSGSEQEYNSDIDEPYDQSHIPTYEDRTVLQREEQEQALLSDPNNLRIKKHAFTNLKQQRRTEKEKRNSRVRSQAQGGGGAELIYEMESGYKDDSSRSSTESLQLQKEKWNQEAISSKPFGRLVLISAIILGIFVLLAYGSYSASSQTRRRTMFSNGTHTFGPTTILISLDGFRADFLQRDLTPAMKAFVESGVSPQYMLPSFPSLTFPNHFTLVTGLYPESHGIVGNQFWDPKMQEEFYYTNISNSMQPKWWNAEPIWVTAERQGLRTAIHMWPGSEAHISNQDPTYLDKYNGSEALDVKVDRILHWLDLPQKDRPQFIAAYVPNVDTDGHLYGPNSTEIRDTIVKVDSMLTGLIEGLLYRNLTEVVNLIIVSDHGMATTSNERVLQLDDMIDVSLVDHMDGWPLRGLRLVNPDRDLETLHQQLMAASRKEQFEVYTLDTMPQRYHFSKNDRIAPLWVVPNAGWVVIEKEDFDIAEARKTGKSYAPRGLHGYDHEDPLMRAIFIARGPSFPHFPNSRIPPFQNIEVYNIVCHSLGIKPHSNNGTLELPFKTEGLHSDFNQPDVPADPAESSAEQTSTTTISETPQISSNADPETAPVPESDGSSVPEKSRDSWLEFLRNGIGKAKQWAKQIIDSFQKNHSVDGEDDAH